MVLPTEFGVPKPWHFIFSDVYKWLQNKRTKHDYEREQEYLLPGDDDAMESPDMSLAAIASRAEAKCAEDSDAHAERERIENMDFGDKHTAQNPLLIRNIRKQYGTGKVAVKSFCLGVERNVVFGLLGPVCVSKVVCSNEVFMKW